MNNNAPTKPTVAPSNIPAPAGGAKHRSGWLILLILILGGGGLYWYFSSAQKAAGAKSAGAAANPTVPVVAAVAKSTDLLVYLPGLGNVTAFNNVTVQSQVGGELIKVAYQEGQEVKQGDLLCQIDPRPYQVQLTQFQGALDRDQASLDNAQLQLQRYQEAKDAIPQQTIDTQKAMVLQLQGNVKTDQGMVDSANLNLTYCNITAHLNGRVGLRLVDQGTIIAPNTNLAVVTQVQPICVTFNLPEDDIPLVQAKFHAGQKLGVSVYNRDFSTKLADGELLALDNQVNQNTATLRLKAVFANQNEILFPSQLVNIRLLLDTLHDVVSVPAAAVQIGPQSSFVYVVKADNTIEQRTVVPRLNETDTITVVPGHGEGEMAAITSGLTAGEMVVTEGFDKLQQGSKVSLSKPDSTKATPDAGQAKNAPQAAQAKSTE